MTIELPIACSLEEQEMATRSESWTTLLADALIEREAISTGVRLVLQSSPEIKRRLEELIELESQCCAWMKFVVSARSVPGGLRSRAAGSRSEATPNHLVVDATASSDLGRQALRELFLTDRPVDALGGESKG